MTAAKMILLVDDDPDILDQIKLILKADGYDVVIANNHREAEEAMASVKPDLAVVDLMMEYKDSGFVLCRQIHQLYPGTPVIILTAVRSVTGLAFQASTPQAKSWLQADSMMDKPVRPEHLRNEIRRLLGQAAT